MTTLTALSPQSVPSSLVPTMPPLEEAPRPLSPTSVDIYISREPAQIEPRIIPPPAPKKVNYGLVFKAKQYGTDTVIIGGTIAVIILALTPGGAALAIVGAVVAALCVIIAAIAKHRYYEEAYLSNVLEDAVGKLNRNVNQLNSDIGDLTENRVKLEATNKSLITTRLQLTSQVGRLQGEVRNLRVKVTDAFDELNLDRAKFEQEKNAKLRQLNDEIAEADSRGNQAQIKLNRLDERESKLFGLAKEVETRRRDLVAAEDKLQNLQASLLRRTLNINS